MKTITVIAAVIFLAIAGTATASTPKSFKWNPAKQKHHVHHVQPPVVIVIDKPVDAKVAQVNRAGYCVNGKFYDMVLGQLQVSDTVTFARYYKGIGITCDHLPGFTFQNTYVSDDGVTAGNYAYFA